MQTTSSAFAQCSSSLALSPAVHHDVHHFLNREALLLDHERYEEWFQCLAAEVCYRTPVPFARAIGVEVPAGADYFEDNYESLTTRIKKLRQPGAESQPRVQMRRLITNVIVCPRKRDEYDVLSYLLITCGSPDSSSCCVISAERYDLVRKAWLSFKIVRREIVMDRRQASSGNRPTCAMCTRRHKPPVNSRTVLMTGDRVSQRCLNSPTSHSSMSL